MKEGWFAGLGKRKSSIARVILKPGKGEIKINGRTLDDYLPREVLRVHLKGPLVTTSTMENWDVVANVKGGGVNGQAGAIRLGIARALLKTDDTLRGVLKKAGYLTRDPRVKERKKYGQAGARRGFQRSKR